MIERGFICVYVFFHFAFVSFCLNFTDECASLHLLWRWEACFHHDDGMNRKRALNPLIKQHATQRDDPFCYFENRDHHRRSHRPFFLKQNPLLKERSTCNTTLSASARMGENTEPHDHQGRKTQSLNGNTVSASSLHQTRTGNRTRTIEQEREME